MTTNSFDSKYRVINKIGEGSFSEVLKCEHKVTNIRYAAKRLRKLYRTEETVKTCAEIIAAQKVPCHLNILNMLEYHYDSFSGKVTFIFELMDMSMFDFLKTQTRMLPENKVKNYLYQILKGLGHLHKYGLFHRDVKPENVLIRLPSLINSPLGHASIELIKLADFGSVRGIYSHPPYTEYISTRWYRSPECLLTMGHYGPKMDVWASGCVFYEMLTLKPLFPGSDELDQLAKIHCILGAPSIQLLYKLLSKSKNCIFFPKLKGSGLEFILPLLSEKGIALLKQMLEYDPDKRSNVRRLLKHKYFDDIKASNHARRISPHHHVEPRKVSPSNYERSTRNSGDYLPRRTMKKGEILRRDKSLDRAKLKKRSGSHKSSGGSGKTRHDNKAKSKGSDQSPSRKIKLHHVTPDTKIKKLPFLVEFKLAHPNTKTVHISSKTTSNLHSFKKGQVEQYTLKQFHSKSFVHPAPPNLIGPNRLESREKLKKIHFEKKKFKRQKL